jgi:hypothetical protein
MQRVSVWLVLNFSLKKIKITNHLREDPWIFDLASPVIILIILLLFRPRAKGSRVH